MSDSPKSHSSGSSGGKDKAKSGSPNSVNSSSMSKSPSSSGSSGSPPSQPKPPEKPKQPQPPSAPAKDGTMTACSSSCSQPKKPEGQLEPPKAPVDEPKVVGMGYKVPEPLITRSLELIKQKQGSKDAIKTDGKREGGGDPNGLHSKSKVRKEPISGTDKFVIIVEVSQTNWPQKKHQVVAADKKKDGKKKK